MESTFSISSSQTTTLALLTLSRALNRHFPKNAAPTQLAARHFRCVYTSNSNSLLPATPRLSSLRSLCVVLPHLRQRLECVSSSAASFTSGGGGSGGIGGESGGGGGGGDGAGSGDTKLNLVVGAAEGASSPSTDVIILDVGGMTCGGCAASVKKILENQPQVSSASVNLTTESAIVWPVSEAKVAPNWQQQLGESLANHLTSCGFSSNLRVAGQGAIEGDISL